MNLTPLKTILAATKEKADELLAPAREKIMKAKAEHKTAEIDMEIATLTNQIEEMFGNKEKFKDFDWDTLMTKLDKIEILEGRKDQYATVLAQLFPSASGVEVKS